MNRRIAVDFRKWLSRPHWRFDMFLLDEDEWGTWLWSPPGTAARRGLEPARTFNHTNVKLIAPGEWWTAIWNDGGRFDLYVDIITPPAWRDTRVTMVDLDLDLVRRADGTVHLDDEDEFEVHRAAYGYPEGVIAKATNTARDVQARIVAGAEPFVAVGRARLAQAREAAARRRP